MRKKPAGVMSRTAGVNPSTRVPVGVRWGGVPHSGSTRETQPQYQRKRNAPEGSTRKRRKRKAELKIGTGKSSMVALLVEA